MTVTNPRRVCHSFKQQLVHSPTAVFPLLCPVRELEWVDGWTVIEVRSATGVAELDCVFTTPAEGAHATWIVTRYEPPHTVHFARFTPGLVATRIEIALAPADTGCTALVTYAHTSLSENGDKFVESFTAQHYRSMMLTWETGLNRFLSGSRDPQS